ncbi:Asp-tRNA(Asn)/Glu-tRNA(Gln) amidotransferase subunit GatB [Peptoniphilus sp. oral taxon 386]|uniref:Asp-tRNA(Asn)/Glu-tRNA(Gln) amidotransferase subunit GatB n=1 Tax=Peptoniphilus sp. oral taxon 386 TaxID=652713 RepID=UPI0001DA9BE0|nr:Asp-tRNA(Asn)/Glu-tRNA(Gln) amidotransferase subunit GatB [Peptoniphilus sp. oral taxon 386]EFI42579.1 aspartyl/glutamyl-tRNA(Asn/Gln) amidotransferase, B subunit [Peptoniphilus sp. oral taxon 386 str. F0131]
MSYKTIVGLEIHVELSTKTKAFCSCENQFGGEPNTRVCPICLGLPGGIPVLNKNVVNYTIMAGLALNCNIAKKSKFDRKNYFYPDLTKGFQITQDDMAICNEGYIEIETEEGSKKVGIYKIQMEEDTGKSLHTEDNSTLMDYNRCGVPLIEIVSKPEMNSGKEARLFLEKLKNTLIYIGVSDCKMEEGSLRCDVNVNVVDEETGKKTAVTEVKNLNSFRGVEKAIDFEVQRHIALLQNGENEIRTTRRWDDANNETVLMRVKYTVADYRFAPEGDLPPVILTDELIEKIKDELPELPQAKKERFMREYKIPEYDAEVLTSTKELSKYYEEVAKNFDDSIMVSNWIMTEVLRRVENIDEEFKLPFEPADFVDLLKAVKSGKINNNAGKKVLREMFETSKKPEDIIKEQGLVQISDTSEIDALVDKVLSDNPQSIEDFKAGKDRAFGFLVGQVMKASKGKANPQLVNKLLTEKLNK